MRIGRYAFIVTIISVVMCHQSTFASSTSDGLVKLLSSKSTWINFNWGNTYQSKLFRSFKWVKGDGKDGILDHTMNADINGIKSTAIVRENNEKTNNKLVILDFKKISDGDASALLAWCIENYGKDYIESPIVFYLMEGVEMAWYKYQWVAGRTVICFMYDGNVGKADGGDLSASIIFRDASKSEIMKPDIKLDCSYTVFFGSEQIKLHEYFVIEARKDGKVKNEKMYSLGSVKAKLTDTSINLIFDTKDKHQELDISRLSGELTGTAYLKNNYADIYRISGECSKFDKLTPKF